MFKLTRSFLRSLHFRILLIIFLTGTIPATVFALGYKAAYEERALTQFGNDMRNQCQILSAALSENNYFRDTDDETLQAEIYQLGDFYAGRILIVDENLQVIKDTYGLEEGQTLLTEDVIRCMRGEKTPNRIMNGLIEVTIPIISGSGGGRAIMGAMHVSAPTDSIYTRLDSLNRMTLIWLLVDGILSLILAFSLSVLLVKPLRHMNKSIAGLADGAFEGELDIRDFTETENISQTFNKMLAQLRVVEESRQEFVSNVSHELKTPLTSMKVLADSLLMQPDAPAELYKEFMEDIAHEIDRENTIISDLLNLVKMDRKTMELNVTNVDINEFLERILKRLSPIARNANVEIVFESNRKVSAEIDETKLMLAFSNLVENAIKYNKENGWVRVMLDADHKYFYVKVTDNGMGIPQDSLDYIFERFYRVDKSHSREIGGTGLGLAITKSAVVAHRGAIKVQSVVNEGTTFTVRIPLHYIA